MPTLEECVYVCVRGCVRARARARARACVCVCVCMRARACDLMTVVFDRTFAVDWALNILELGPPGQYQETNSGHQTPELAFMLLYVHGGGMTY